jgi:galactose-1-phosphate uridylyltransferase
MRYQARSNNRLLAEHNTISAMLMDLVNNYRNYHDVVIWTEEDQIYGVVIWYKSVPTVFVVGGGYLTSRQPYMNQLSDEEVKEIATRLKV